MKFLREPFSGDARTYMKKLSIVLFVSWVIIMAVTILLDAAFGFWHALPFWMAAAIWGLLLGDWHNKKERNREP